MPVLYRIHSSLQIVHTTIDGPLETSAFRSYSEQLKSDPGFDPAFNHVIEFHYRGDSSDGVTAAQVFSYLVPPISRVQMAIVAPRDLEFGISRRFQVIYELSDEAFAVFRSLDDALTWLGIDDPQPEWGPWQSIIVPNSEESLP